MAFDFRATKSRIERLVIRRTFVYRRLNPTTSDEEGDDQYTHQKRYANGYTSRSSSAQPPSTT